MLHQTCSQLIHLIQFVKYWQIFLELNSKGLFYVNKHKNIESLNSPVHVFHKTCIQAVSCRGLARTAI